jgi:hypothetical protein
MPPMLPTKVLEGHRAQLIAYLKMKVVEEDWHGVADAAMDLREIEAQLAIHKGGHHG